MKTAKWKTLFAAGLAVLGSLLATSVGSAHANQLRSSPADGSILEESPREISIWFDEPISERFNSVQLFDVDSQPVAVAGIRRDSADPTHLIISVPELSSGVYSVLWKILSEVDGHYNQGLLVFGVGADTDLGAASIAPVKATTPFAAEVVLRWLNLLMLSGFIGGIAMIQLVLKPAELEASKSAKPVPVFKLIRHGVLAFAVWCAGGGMVVGLGFLVWQVFILRTSLSQNAPLLDAIKETLIQTRWGAVWLTRQLVLLCAGAVAFYLHRKQRQRKLGQAIPESPAILLVLMVLALSLIVLQALSSHAAGLVTQSAALAIVSHGLHLLAACLWMGGLLCVGIILLPLFRKHREATRHLVRVAWRPFSRVAGLSIGILLATGLYNTSQQVASLDALLTSLYGKTLLLKLGLLFAIGYFGLFNVSLLHPSLSDPLMKIFRLKVGWTPLELHHLPRLVLTKGGLSLLLLLATGLITAAPAPRDSRFTVDPQDVRSTLSQTVDDLVITLNAKPNRPGQNVFTVFAASTRRPAPAEVARVILRFTYRDQDIGRQSVILEEVEPSRYLLGGNYMRLAGNWQIDVVIRRRGMEDSVARFDWVVAPPGDVHPVLVSKAPLVSTLALSAAVFLLCIPLHTLFVNRARQGKIVRKPTQRKPRRIFIDTREKIDESEPFAMTIQDGN